MLDAASIHYAHYQANGVSGNVNRPTLLQVSVTRHEYLSRFLATATTTRNAQRAAAFYQQQWPRRLLLYVTRTVTPVYSVISAKSAHPPIHIGTPNVYSMTFFSKFVFATIGTANFAKQGSPQTSKRIAGVQEQLETTILRACN